MTDGGTERKEKAEKECRERGKKDRAKMEREKTCEIGRVHLKGKK